MLIRCRFTILTLLELGIATNVTEFFGVQMNCWFDSACRITLNECAIFDLGGCLDSGLI